MNDKQVARELVKLARSLVAAINKGDIVQIDLGKAKSLMPDDEYGALEIYARKSNGIGIAETFNSRKDTWIVSIEGARGSFDVPEVALKATGGQDPNMFMKQLGNLVQVLPVGAKFVEVEYFGSNMRLNMVNVLSAPPMTTNDVSSIEKRMISGADKFKKFLSGVLSSVKFSHNRFILMAAESGKIEFRLEISVSVKKPDMKKLEAVSEYIESKLT